LQGGTGDTGALGLQGVQGITGAAGTPGATGLQGDTGAIGAAGDAGSQGDTGARGPDGAQGTPGAVGEAGPTGPPGETGPAGSGGISEYAYIYNVAAQTAPLEAAYTFDSNGVLSSGIRHTAGSAAIELVNSGTYKVTYSVSGTEPNQMALFVQGAVVPGTVYGSGAGTQPNTGQALVTVAPGDLLTVRNHTSSAAVGLATPIGGTRATTNASVSIEKLG
jgi:hypothetical protein